MSILHRMLDLFRGAKTRSISHPVFGEISLRQGKNGPYWMRDAYENGELTISIETRGEEVPSVAQVNFFVALTTDWDATFAQVSELFVPRYEHFFDKALPSEWRSVFVPAGVGVPLDGANDKPWDVAFECITDNSGFLFTCYFENGNPTGVTVDT